MTNNRLLKMQAMEVVDGLLDKEFVNYSLKNDNTIHVSLLNKRSFDVSVGDELSSIKIKLMPNDDMGNVRNITVNHINQSTIKRISTSIKNLIISLNDSTGNSPTVTLDNQQHIQKIIERYPNFSYSKQLDRLIFDGNYYTYEWKDDTVYVHVSSDTSKSISIDYASICLNAIRK